VTTVHHIAHAIGSTGTNVPPYRVDLRVGLHQLVGDEPPDAGGGDIGPSPFGLLSSALAACTATTLRMYAERHDWELSTIEVDVRYDVDDDRQGTIARSITVPVDLSGDQVDALASIAERTPVTRAIRAGTPITTTMRQGA
jgi:putative redox protein